MAAPAVFLRENADMSMLADCLLGLVAVATSASQPPADSQEGLRALADGEYEVAVDVFSDITRLSPEVAAAQFDLGLAFEGLGQPESAVESLRRAVELNNKVVAYRVELARLLLDIGQAQEASAMLHAEDLDSLEADTCSQVAFLSAQAATRIGCANDAVRLLRERLRVDPDNRQLHHALGVALHTLGQRSAALEELARPFDLDPQSLVYGRAAVHIAFATARAARDRDRAGPVYARAGELAERLVALRPSFDHLLLAGEAWMEAGQWERALKWFDVAHEQQPRGTVALLYLGRCHSARGDYRHALEEL